MQIKDIVIREVEERDISTLQDLIKQMALYEKRPEDMTGTKQMLKHWILERKIATALLVEYEKSPIGYIIYYPIFGSFAAAGNVHLEDLFIKEEYRNQGIGAYVFSSLVKRIQEEGYSKIEWSCLDWNVSSLGFYEKLGATYETGRKYLEYSPKNIL